MFAVKGFAGGINVKDVPQWIGDSDLTMALNGYLKPGGGFASRMGMTLKTTLGATSTTPISGLARFYQEIKNGSAVVSSPFSVAQVGNQLYNVDTNTAIGTIGTGFMQCVHAQDPNDPNFTSGLTDVLVICTGTGGPYVYDGVNLYTPAGWSAAAGAKYCAVVNGIIYFGGIPGAPNQVFGTGNGQLGDVSMETLPAWRNFAYTGFVTGLCALGSGAQAVLCVGRQDGATLLGGTGIDNYYQQDVPFGDGVTPYTMLPVPGGLIFLGNQAVYFFDGYNPPQRLSDKIEPWVLNDALTGGYVMSSRTSCFAWVYENRYHLAYNSTFVTGSGANTILVYDLIEQGWTVLVTTPGISCATLLNAPGDSAPWKCLVGSSQGYQVFNWDVEPVAGQPATDNGVPFIITFQTKFYTLGVPGTNKVLTRLYPALFVSGSFEASVLAQSDYGNTQSAETFLAAVQNANNEWDQAQWDVGQFGGSTSWIPFVAPATRTDFDSLEGDTFSFGIQTNAATSPFIIGGFTGAFHQRGAT